MEATEKQVQLIARLVEEREISPTGTARLLLEMWEFDRTRETATVLIDALMALPRLVEAPAPCGWCGDTTPGHKHYAVLIRENGKSIGRLGTDGYAVNRKLFAHVFGKARATEVAEEINARPPHPGITAHVIRF